MTLALLAAVLGAIGYGGGSVLQAVGANRAVAAGHGVLGVARQWPYLAGLACDLAGWLLSLAALRRLPLFAVQAILGGSLAVTVVLAAAVMHVRARPADRYAISLIIAALVVLGAAAGPEHSQPVRAGGRRPGGPCPPRVGAGRRRRLRRGARRHRGAGHLARPGRPAGRPGETGPPGRLVPLGGRVNLPSVPLGTAFGLTTHYLRGRR